MNKPCTKEENAELFQQIFDGNQAAKERFIEGNMAYVVAAVEDYVGKRPQFEYLQDDLISEGYLALVRASKNPLKVEFDNFNPQGFLSVCLTHAFDKLATKEKKKETEPLNKNMLWENKYEKCSKHEVLIACEDNLEKQIMTMHLHGYTDREIAQAVAIERLQVLRIRKAINKKLQTG